MTDDKGNCFNVFDITEPKKKEPSIQVLYDYEKHYMELVREYAPEISLIGNMLRDLREEQKNFYGEILPEISDKLSKEPGIDADMKKLWLDRLVSNMERSFGLSETLVNNYATKSIDEFKEAVKDKLRRI